MIDWSHRHPGPELMDRSDIPEEDLFQNYRELHIINKWLGGYHVTLQGLSLLIKDRSREYSIIDVGCGGGDTLNEIEKWATGKRFQCRVSGLDRSKAAINYAKAKNKKAKWICDDVFHHLNSGIEYDIITCSLFLHHFSDKEIVQLLKLMIKFSRVGVVINDLNRHPVAYNSIKWLTKFFSKSYLVKNDAPLSVLRGFKKEEWLILAQDSGTIELEKLFERPRHTSWRINWLWPFRYLIVIGED